MRAVVVVAHPNPDSLCHAIAARVQRALDAGGHHVIVHDLYAEGFRAAMSADEREAYHGNLPAIDPLVIEHIADVQEAQTLVFVYPTWWSTMPTVLKGWFERVMVPGVGFVFDADNKVRPGLTNVQRLMGISTYGSPWWSVKAVNDNGRRTIERALRLSTGWGTRSTWLALYRADSRSTAERERFLDRVERKVRAL